METEVDKEIKKQNDELIKVASYERLNLNEDFKVFYEDLILKKIDDLREILETSEGDELKEAQYQLRALKGVKSLFEKQLTRRKEIETTLEELKND